jgi:hypothetical protein
MACADNTSLKTRISRRKVTNSLGLAGAAYIATELPKMFPIGEENVCIEVTIRGRKARLRQCPSSRLVSVHAQYAYYPFQYQNPYAYYGTYQMWAQWNYAQYQAYMYRLAQQQAWLSAYMSPLGQFLSRFADTHSLSEPFPMPSVRSVYSYGESFDGRGKDVVAGLNSYRQPVAIEGRAVSLMSAISSIGEDERWVDVEIEASAGPQSNSGPGQERINNRSFATEGYRTRHGVAFVTNTKFEDTNTKETGNLIVFDTKNGKERNLVALS